MNYSYLLFESRELLELRLRCSGINRCSSNLHGFAKFSGFTGSHQRSGRVHQHNVLSRTLGSAQYVARNCGILFFVAARKIRRLGLHDTEIAGVHNTAPHTPAAPQS